MRELVTTVRSQHSALRDLFPFYSVDMALFGVAIVAATYCLMRWLDPPTAITIATGGYVGMAFVNWTAEPSYFWVPPQQQSVLTSTLEGLHYRYVPARDHWVPPLPRWLRWKFNFVKFCPEGHAVKVVGPANILQHLAAQLT